MAALDIPIIIVAFLIGAIIMFLLWFYRDTIFAKRTAKTVYDQDIERYLDQIRQMARSHKYRDAALLVYQTLAIAAYGFMGITREPRQTARQFAMSLTSNPAIDPSAVMNVVELFEIARYSNEEITTTQWNEGLGGLHRFLQTATAMKPVEAAPAEEAAPAPEEEASQ